MRLERVKDLFASYMPLYTNMTQEEQSAVDTLADAILTLPGKINLFLSFPNGRVESEHFMHPEDEDQSVFYALFLRMEIVKTAAEKGAIYVRAMDAGGRVLTLQSLQGINAHNGWLKLKL